MANVEEVNNAAVYDISTGQLQQSSVEIMNRGMECLKDHMGIVDAEKFISLIIRERFDYTRWQRDFFDKMEPGEFGRKAVEYAQEHPFKGNANRV